MNASGTGLTDAVAESPVIETSTALLLIALGVLVFVIKAVADIRRDVDQIRVQRHACPAPERAKVTPVAEDELSSELKAVITAAVYVALSGTTGRILKISAPAVAAEWSLEGRRDVFGSHRPR